MSSPWLLLGNALQVLLRKGAIRVTSGGEVEAQKRENPCRSKGSSVDRLQASLPDKVEATGRQWNFLLPVSDVGKLLYGLSFGHIARDCEGSYAAHCISLNQEDSEPWGVAPLAST